ncbi:mucin-4-like [Lagopus leucura]|uniref:mucin-4-like n=1 Tax=Lagopus leucura TaxID=30410 RepID=UPI001C6659F0|nr:mucin-4-like [Lagopus leucura]
MAESILVSASVSPSFPSWAEPDLVTETTGYNSSLGAERDAELSTGEVTQAPTEVPQVGTDVATSLDATQKNQSGLAAATAAAIVVTPQPNFTPSTKHNVTGTTAAAPSGSTPIFADVPASTTRAGGGLESTTDAMFLPSVTIPTAAGTQALTTTPLHPHVTALPTAVGAEVEGVTLPGDSKGDGRTLSSIPSPGASGFLPTPWTNVVSGTVGDTPGWAALESGDLGDAANGVFSTADTSQLPPESVAALETAENPGQSSLLTDQAGPSPANLLGPGDGDKQGAPTVLLSGPDSALSDTSSGPVGPPSPDIGAQPGTGLTALGGVSSAAAFEPSLSSSPVAGLATGTGLLPGTGAEAAVSPDLGAAPEASVSPSLSASQPWDTAVGAPEDTALPGAEGPSSGFSSVLAAPSSASYGPEGPPSPGIGAQPGTGLTALGAEGQVLGGVSSAAIFEPSPSSSPGTGLKARTDLLPAALSPSGPASPSDVLTAPSASDTPGPSVLGGAGGAPSALQPSLVAAPGLHSAAGGVRDGAEAVSADGEAPGQSQDQTGTGAAVASSGRQGSTLISISSSLSADGSSLPEAAAGADTGAGIPRAGGAGSSSGFGAAALQSNKEIPILPPTIQSNANVGPPDAKLSQVNVVELAGGKLEASAQGSPPASGGNGLGTVIQIASGVSSSSIPTSPQETQPLVPVAPAASSPLMVAASASARGVGDTSVPNAGPASASSTQSGSSPPAVPRPPVDEMASGMLAPLGEELQHAPNAAPALPSASERENLKEGAATSPQLSSLISATPGQPAATLTPPPLPPVPAVPLYRYGVRENDHEYVQRRVDFNSPLFKPEIGFPFGKTLRDSLYFTDNGQIIFPASDSSIFTLPNPPARGFTGHESVPMIAVFWDNADFSRGTGTTFYQEFLTLNSEKPPFIRDVEAKVRHYLRSSYSAAWTLKITWEKAPAYGARGDSRRTNTYQAVLTTDGFRSYVLILYKDGGMQWDYTQLPATNVLIGYTSGDGHYHNDDLTQGSPAAKYRPDRYRGYNTDLRGLWLYKLESRVGINYRLKCLAWTGQQQEPQEWSHNLPACPCSLQQGQQDRRFRSGHGGWGSARVSMLHSASPNSHGAGVRCLYDGRGQLVEGRQERYWRASRQASPYRDQELKLYDWCCNQAGSARLCARYNEKRPRIGCDGYRAHSAEDSSEDSDSKEQRDEEEE